MSGTDGKIFGFPANPLFSIFADCGCEIAEGPFYARNEKRLYWVNPESPNNASPVCIMRKTGPAIRDFEEINLGIGSVSAFSQRADGTFLLFGAGCRVWFWKPGSRPELFTQLESSCPKFNDVTTTPDGHVFCTTLPADRANGTGELFDLAPDGSFKRLDCCRGIPNGMGFSPDGSIFYFTATTEKTIYQYRYENGQISGKKNFASGFGCDGLAVDSAGGVWSAGWREKLRRLTPDGKIDMEINLPGMVVSSLCFGGPELRNIYVTTANRPYEREKFFQNHAGCVLVWKNSPFQGMPIPFFQ